MTGHCPPGEHIIPSISPRWPDLCAPDVPGAGLPWDVPTAISAIGCAAFLLICIAWLLVISWKERGSRK